MVISGIYMYQVTSTICNMRINGIYIYICTIVTSTICNMVISGIYIYTIVTSTICNMVISGIYVP